MGGAVWILWLGLTVCCLMDHARLHRCCDVIRSESLTHAAIVNMLATETCGRHSVLLLSDGSAWATSVFKDITEIPSPWGVGVFRVTGDSHGHNLTLSSLSNTTAQARSLVTRLYCVTVVVVSDDPAFLAAFFESSFKSHLLLVQTTKLLVFTRLPLHRLHTLHHLHKTQSRTNSLISVISDNSTEFRARVYSMVPFSEPESQPLGVATWTVGRGLVLGYLNQLFPHKFAKFPHRPHLVVTTDKFPSQNVMEVDDPTQPGGKRVIVQGVMDNMMQLIARRMNLTYSYVRAADRAWGARLNNGSWTGMLGLLMREEVDLALGPFSHDWTRYTWMDFSRYVSQVTYKIFAARARPEVDPWGFLLPLSPLVWAALTMALLAVITVMLFLPSCLPTSTQHTARRDTNIFNCVRVLFQEDIGTTTGWWWWERVVLGVWMLMILVLTQSYTGNLMSLLAVRHIINPYEDLRDVLDSGVGIILMEYNVNTQYLRSVKTGVFRELGDLLDTERVVYNSFIDMPASMNTLVRSGTHILFDIDSNFWNMMGVDFSRTGRCDFYLARSSYFVYQVAIMANKNSPLIPAVNQVAEGVVEFGLFDKWQRYSLPNTTSCLNTPRVITVTAVLSLSNLWGMFVILGIGLFIGILIFLLEVAPVAARPVLILYKGQPSDILL